MLRRNDRCVYLMRMPLRFENPDTAPLRIDGRAKVTGSGMYTGDFTDATLTPYLHRGEIAKPILYAVTAPANISLGRVDQIDASAALALPGVVALVTHENAPRLKKVNSLLMSEQTKFLPLQSDAVLYRGQPLAVVVATSFETAVQAASLLKIRYVTQRALIDFEGHRDEAVPVKKVGANTPAQEERGEPDVAWRLAGVRLDEMYTMEPAHHNAMEPGATLAHWHPEDGEVNRITVLSSTQFVYGDAVALAEAFDIGHKDKILRIVTQVAASKQYASRVRVAAPLVGGGFGSKGGNNHLMLAAMAARLVGHPVKLVLTRQDTFSQMPYRGAVDVHLQLGSDAEGKLQVLRQHGTLQSSKTGSFLEPTAEITTHLYAVPHLRTSHSVLRLNTNSPGWMRAPGVTPGQFALESAMDELAVRLHLDPLELRLRNYAEVDPADGKPWSSKSLRECYAAAAEQFRWQHRRVGVRSQERQGDEWIGYGMATAAYKTNHFPATARVSLLADGTVLAQSAAHEIGQGAITTLTQVVADELCLPLERLCLEIGDTDLPFGAFSAGSSTSLSVGSALQLAARDLGVQLARLARTDKHSPLYRCGLREIVFHEGQLRHTQEHLRREVATDLLQRHGLDKVQGRGVSGRMFGRSSYGRCAFGAQFVRVAVSETTGVVRVLESVGAFAAGRILNARTARSQLLGGMVWGIGHALLEQSVVAPGVGGWLNSNLAEAHVPVNADVPSLEALLIAEDDSRGSALGAKGLGEIGIVGVAAAIANAIFHATGKRLRHLPITPDAVLAAAAQ